MIDCMLLWLTEILWLILESGITFQFITDENIVDSCRKERLSAIFVSYVAVWEEPFRFCIIDAVNGFW